MDTHSASTPLADQLKKQVGRFTNKSFDWNAFPSNAGYADLERGQMRYIGAGGSPKVGDQTTLAPEHFTLSLIHQEVGKYAACHEHEIEEAFLVLNGVVTIGWEKDGDVVEVQLGPKDMVLNAKFVPHGFRNAGVDPVLMSIMVGAGKPLPPRYLYHPKNTDPELAAAFGAKPGHVLPFDPQGEHPLQKLMAQYVVRFSEQKTSWDKAGIGHKVYVGEGGIAPSTACKEMLMVPRGIGVKPYVCQTEEAFFVLEGCLTVGWEENGQITEQRLGPKDVVLTPAGRVHYFRNDDLQDALVFSVIGGDKLRTTAFERA